MSPTIKDNYRYVPLKEDEIRLLKLHIPSSTSVDMTAELEGELLTFKLELLHTGDDAPKEYEEKDLPPPYDALSYVWGEAEPETALKLWVKKGEQVEYRFLPIRPHLEAALRRFRYKVQRSRLLKGQQHHGEAALQDQLYLWIDAICIDQETPREQSAQIRKMADIYSQAELVRIWLDEASDDSSKAVEFIRTLRKLENFDELSKDADLSNHWAALRNFMQRPWFKRRWVIQEIAYARRARVYCGEDELSWKDIESTITCFVLKREELRRLFHQSKETGHNPDFLGEIDGYGAKVLVETLDLVLRKSEDGDVLGHLLALETLVSTLTVFDAKFPHDYIYAILYLCKDARPGSQLSREYSQPKQKDNQPGKNLDTAAKPSTDDNTANKSWIPGDHFRGSPQSSPPREAKDGSERRRGRSRLKVEDKRSSQARSISRGGLAARIDKQKEYNIVPTPEIFWTDYDMSMYSLCTDFVNFAVERSKSIDIICRAWVPDFKQAKKDASGLSADDKLPMPSWLSPVNKRPFGVRPGTESRVYSRVAADSLVGTSIKGLKTYDASGDFVAARQRPNLIVNRRLSARGFIVDSIGDTCGEALNAVIPARWFRTGAVNTVDRSARTLDRFWRTLVANRATSEGPQRPPSHWSWAFHWLLERRVKSEGANLDISQFLMGVVDSCPSPVVEFIQRVRAVVWNRQLFVTKRIYGDPLSPMLGLVPETARPGDMICILHGCSVPVVLRKVVKRLRPSTPERARESDTASTPGHRRKLRPSRYHSVPVTEHIPFDVATVGAGSVLNVKSIETSEHLAKELDSLSRDTTRSAHTDTTIGVTVSSPQLGPQKDKAGRPQEDLPAPEPDEYELIGECYVHGLMDGEAFLIQKHSAEPELVDRDFWIV